MSDTGHLETTCEPEDQTVNERKTGCEAEEQGEDEEEKEEGDVRRRQKGHRVRGVVMDVTLGVGLGRRGCIGVAMG